MAPIRRKLVAPIAAIALLLQNVGGFVAVDPPRDYGSSSSMKRSVQTNANGFSRHGHQQLPSCVNQRQWSCTNIAAFARHPHRDKGSFTILASRSQRGSANANSSSKEEGVTADRTTRVREMAAFLTASLTQTIISRMDPTKEVSPQEQRALSDLLGAVLTPPSPSPPPATPTESFGTSPSASSLEHGISSEKSLASDPAVTVTTPEASVEENVKEFEDQSPDKLRVDEAIVKTPPKVTSEPTAIDDNGDAIPPKPRLEAALKKALERSESLEEDTPTTTSSTNPDEATGMAVATLEKAESLHKREGDRVVALKDEFATEEVVAEAGGAESSTLLSKKGEAAATTMGEDHAAVSIVTSDGPLRKVDTVQNLVPPTPEAISTAFGRPLPVVIQDVPPLKSVPELATAGEKTAAPTVTSGNKSAAGFSSNEENGETANNATVAAAGASTLSSSLAAEQENVVQDEDAYGE